MTGQCVVADQIVPKWRKATSDSSHDASRIKSISAFSSTSKIKKKWPPIFLWKLNLFYCVLKWFFQTEIDIVIQQLSCHIKQSSKSLYIGGPCQFHLQNNSAFWHKIEKTGESENVENKIIIQL